MRLGRLTLTRPRTDLTTVAVRMLTLIVGREGAAASGSATQPRTANIPAFSSLAVIPAFQSTATIPAFKSSVVVPAFQSTATIPVRITTVTDMWLTSP